MKNDNDRQNRLQDILNSFGLQTYDRLAWRIEEIFGSTDYSGKSICEIGCGGCEYSAYLAVHGAKSVLAVDSGGDGNLQWQLDRRRKLLAELPLDNFTFRPIALDQIQSDEQLDLVFGISVVEHFHETPGSIWRDADAVRAYQEAFASLNRLLRPGGVLILSDVTRQSLPRFIELLLRRRIRWPFNPDIDWNIHQTPKTWKTIAAHAGFANFRIRWHTPYRAQSLKFLVGNRVSQFFTSGAYYFEAQKTLA
jgi:2-polyprenyl-3-methyl-5-hydroxy-6-metoxy-1,4-benzoquinol methylase